MYKGSDSDDDSDNLSTLSDGSEIDFDAHYDTLEEEVEKQTGIDSTFVQYWKLQARIAAVTGKRRDQVPEDVKAKLEKRRRFVSDIYL